MILDFRLDNAAPRSLLIVNSSKVATVCQFFHNNNRATSLQFIVIIIVFFEGLSLHFAVTFALVYGRRSLFWDRALVFSVCAPRFEVFMVLHFGVSPFPVLHSLAHPCVVKNKKGHFLLRFQAISLVSILFCYKSHILPWKPSVVCYRKLSNYCFYFERKTMSWKRSL